MGNKEAYENLTLEMLDEFIRDLSSKPSKDNPKIFSGKQGVLEFMKVYLGPFLSEEKLDERLKEIGDELREGIYEYDGMEFTYQGRV